MTGILDFGTDETAQAGGAAPSIHGSDMDTSIVQLHTTASTSPTVNDDINSTPPFRVGSIWVRLDTNQRWQCDDNTNGAAVWTELTGGANTDLSNLTATGQDKLCAAWVNFNGTGTVAIRDSFNVSSITDNGVGNYTMNFASALSNANYAPSFAKQLVATSTSPSVDITTMLAASIRFRTLENAVVVDPVIVTATINGGL
ncbi:MAG: hypothetical protein KAR40_11205 [Candidatus Sabulitectum sp.]|nr:hypothetical protein [Candidatus Sabulitectum sp.]